MQNIDQIIATGRRWTKGQMDRVYFSSTELLAIFGGYESRAQVYLYDIDGAEYGENRRGPMTDRRCVDPATDDERTASGALIADWWQDDKGRWHEGARGKFWGADT